MGYYVRVLGTSNPDIHLDELKEPLKKLGHKATFEISERETTVKWTGFDLKNNNGDPLMQVERNVVKKGELGFDELQQFREEVEECQPASAAKWLNTYFDKVKVIYSFQLLHHAYEEKNWPILDIVRSAIRAKTGGILQADDEGFTNEDGSHILWQFDKDVKGKLECAVLVYGKWENFSMNLGDAKQRAEFQEGKVPAKAIRL